MSQVDYKMAKSRIDEISSMLVRGNQRSKNVARIISSLTYIMFNENREKIKSVLDKIVPIYDELYRIHNQLYYKLGGTGSGENVEAPVETAVDIMNLRGIDLEGYNTLQQDAINIGNIALRTQDPGMEIFNIFIWTGLVSVHNEKLQNKLVKIILQFDTRLS